MCWLLGATVHMDRLSYYTPPSYPYTHTVVRTIVSVQSKSVPYNGVYSIHIYTYTEL